VRAEWPTCRAPPCTVCACLELSACELTANAAALQLGLGPRVPEFGELCQWDGAQPEGRRCTAKPAVVDVLALASSSCRARSYQYPAPEGLGPPNSAADCEAVGPWCEYRMGDDGDQCDIENDGPDAFLAAITAVAAAAPTEVLPPLDCVETTADASTCTAVGQELYTLTTAAANGGAVCTGSSTLCVAGDGTIPSPPPAPTPGTSAADLTAISLATGLAGLAVALG
jgi:hypothetical protein